MLLQTRIHRHTVRKVGATPPPLPLCPFPNALSQPAGRVGSAVRPQQAWLWVGLCWVVAQSWVGLSVSPRLEKGPQGKIQDCSLNKSLTSFSFLFFTCFRNLRMRSNISQPHGPPQHILLHTPITLHAHWYPSPYVLLPAPPPPQRYRLIPPTCPYLLLPPYKSFLTYSYPTVHIPPTIHVSLYIPSSYT